MTEPRRVRPELWAILFLPFGVTGGFVIVTLGYRAKHAGFDDAAVAGLVAMNVLPNTWKFFWAPIVDAFWNRKAWYLTANLFSCASLLAMGLVPINAGTATLLSAMVFLNGFAITFLGMAVESLMAHTTRYEDLGKASGWMQAGNLGGSGIGGGAALLLSQHFSPEIASIVMAVLLSGCTLGLLVLPAAERVDHGSLWRSLAEVVRDVGRTLFTRGGVFAMTLCFMPLGAGAASNLFSAIADRWHASADLVSWSTGIIGGLAAAVGCLAGGWLSDRMNRRLAYAVSGVLLALVAIGMAILPANPWTYGGFTLAYSYAAGMCYGAFTGFVLEIIGKGAAATKYNVLASLSNVPIWYMTLTDGWASKGHGPRIMLWVDAGAGAAGLVILSLLYLALRPARPAAPSASG